MGKRAFSGFVLFLVALALVVTIPADAKDKDKKFVEKFSGRAYTMSKGGSAATSSVNISVRRWSTEEERQGFLKVLNDGGEEALAQAFRSSEDLGFIVFDTGRQTLRYAHSEMVGDQRRIVLATDRPISYGEERGRTRTLNYPISVIEFQLPEKGKGGEGTITVMAQFIWDEETQQLATKSYSAQPLRFVSIKSR